MSDAIRPDLIADLERSLEENSELWAALAQADRDQDIAIQQEHMLAVLNSLHNWLRALDGQLKEFRRTLAEMSQRLDRFQECEDRQDTALTELESRVIDLENVHRATVERTQRGRISVVIDGRPLTESETAHYLQWLARNQGNV